MLLFQIKGRANQTQWEAVTGGDQVDLTFVAEYTVKEASHDKENDVKVDTVEPQKDDKPTVNVAHVPALENQDEGGLDVSSDEGWQEAVPKGRSAAGRKPSGRRPSLSKLNTNSLNNSDSSRYKARSSPGFSSPRSSPNDAAPAATIFVPKTLAKSSSFSPKQANPAASPSTAEKSANAVPPPASPAVANVPAKPAPLPTSVTVQSSRKPLSYKEVALAPPGTIVRVVEDHAAKEAEGSDQDDQTSKGAGAAVGTQSDLAACSQGDKENESPEEDPETSEETKIHATGEKEKEEEATEAGVPQHQELDSSVESNASSSEKDKDNTATAAPVPPAVEESESPETASLETPKVSALEGGSTLQGNVSGAAEKEAQAHDDGSPQLSSGGDTELPSPTEPGKLEETAESVKEPNRKLSAAAPPFNPSIVPVFSSIAVPGYGDHGGILPPPVNIAPMLAVNPIRKSSYQSATARVPYGPRLSGGYSRSGSRVPRNKPALQNCEVDGNGFSSRIMNPHAAEFVPGQQWLPNGQPASPNGLVSPTGAADSPQSILLSPDGSETPPTPTVEDGDPCVEEVNPHSEEASVEAGIVGHLTTTSDASVQTEESSAAPVADAEDHSANREAPEEDGAPNGEPVKSWADYSDGEAEVVEVAS